MAGVSYSGSIENDTKRTSADRIDLRSTLILAVVIGHMVTQRVKMKSAIQTCPRNTDASIERPSTFVKAKAATSESTGRRLSARPTAVGADATACARRRARVTSETATRTASS